MSTPSCVFCQIVAGNSPATVVESWPDALAIVPLGPVTEGHVLVLPRAHVRDFVEDPVVTAAVMARAAQLAQTYDIAPANLITSAGRAATQSVFHLHVHVVPRRENDGLALPWYSGRSRRTTVPIVTAVS